MSKLTQSERDMLKLIVRSVAASDNPDGWAPVSNALCASVMKFAPAELVEFESLGTGGRVRLTEKGKIVAEYL